MIITAKNGMEIDLDDFKNAGYGQFTKFVREHIDDSFRQDGKPKKFKIKMTAYKKVAVECECEVYAYTEKGALKKAEAADINDMDWTESIYSDDDIEDVEIDTVEELSEGDE